MNSLLVVDDDVLVSKCFRYAFNEDEIGISTAATAKEALDLIRTKVPDVIICDVRLPDQNGLDLLAEIRRFDNKIPVIMMTGYASAEVAIEAMRRGAFDYILKPLDPDHLTELVERAFNVSRMMRVPLSVGNENETTSDADAFIGRSLGMQEVFKAVGRVAPTDATVLILGDSGTGKELVARAIYQYGGRANKPFLAINCAAIPETLLESELFGHERGSFTGADKKRIGKFEQCHGGTLFLDEIGDMTLMTQAKVLRVLQDKTFERVGGNETVESDVRIIAATNRDLDKMLAQGTFRDDLYYRLNVCTIRIPPLRERGEDIPLLVHYFVRKFGKEFGKDAMTVAEDAMKAIMQFAWPGNIRQLQSVVKHALLNSVGPIITLDALPDEMKPGNESVSVEKKDSLESQLKAFIQKRLSSDSNNLYEEVLQVFEKVMIAEVLKKTGGNISHAATILGITRPTLRSKLSTLGMEMENKVVFNQKEG